MRIGCSTIPLAPLSGEDALRTIADLGFDVVDIAAVPTVFDHILTVDAPSDQADRFAALVEELGLEVNGVQTVAWIPDALDDFPEHSRRCAVAADVAAAVDARCWIVDAGRHADGEDHGVAVDRFKRNIKMQYELAAERNLRLVVEAPHGGTLAASYGGINVVLNAAAEVNADIALDLDTRPVQNCGVSAEQVISRYGNRIAHVAVADTSDAKAGHVPMGEGEVDFQLFVEQLSSVGFEGDLMLELEPKGSSVDERITFIKRDRDHLNNILSNSVAGRGER